MRLYIFAMCLWFGHMQATQAQSIRRSVISSMGASQMTSSGLRFQSTTAQPPNAGTISGNNIILRQGFQQPAGCQGVPLAAFDFQNTTDGNCASPFSFTFTGVATETTNFLWQFGEGASQDSSTLIEPPIISYASPGTKEVSLTLSNGECTSTFSLQLEVDQTPIVLETVSQELICYEDQDGFIDLNISGGISPYDVSWNTGASGTQLSDLSPGLYEYTLVDAVGCTIIDTILVDGPDSLSVLSTVINESCQGTNDGSIVLDIVGGTPPFTYAWSNGSTDPNQIALGTGIYSVTLTDDNKCEQILSVEVGNNCSELTIYDVITPNGDGQNDNWLIDGIENFPDNELQIFDRWGRVVYSAKAYTGNWDGRHNDGTLLPFGAYYYLLELNDLNNTIYKGSISIVY